MLHWRGNVFDHTSIHKEMPWDKENGRVVNVGMGYGTNLQIKGLELILLEDDKHFFPIYNAASVMNKTFFNKHPDLVKITSKNPYGKPFR